MIICGLNLFLTLIHIKNVKFTIILKKKSPQIVQKNPFLIDYLQVLKSVVYLFIHKENKSIKFAPINSKKIQIEYDEKTIYRDFIEKDMKSSESKFKNIRKREL